MIRSLPRKLTVRVDEPLILRGFELPANTTLHFSSSEESHPCTVHRSSTRTLWIIFTEAANGYKFGLSLHTAWDCYVDAQIDFEGVEPEFVEKRDLEEFLRSYVSN